MRTLFITLSCLLAAITGNVYAANANSEKDEKVSEVRKVEAFSSVNVTSVGVIYFTQSDTYSLKIEGKEEYVKNTSSSVNKGCLAIGFKNRKSTRNRKDDVTIYLSAPDLKEVEFAGVGFFYCNKPLKMTDIKFLVKGVGELKVNDLTCRSLKVDLKGVGNADIHVKCDKLSAHVSGIGNVTLSGTTGYADISRGGIGNVTTNNLKVGK